jgi:hypothetical protein
VGRMRACLVSRGIQIKWSEDEVDTLVRSALICHSLTSFVYFLLSVALGVWFGSGTCHPIHHSFKTTYSCDNGEDGVAGDNKIEPPCPVAENCDENDVDPGPVENIPHEFG